MTRYDERFFRVRSEGSRRSADVVAPLLAELVRPRSVVDVGCGTGTWLAAFRELGVEDVLGVDGAYVPADQLQIPSERFVAADLTAPLDLGRRFDLVLCLEVGEHLPAAAAGRLVASLAALGSVVAFSAAVPGQLGEGHVNEQWQDYWASLFAEHGLVPVDAVRRRVWDDPEVAWWYAQNLLVYASEEELARNPRLLAERELMGARQLVLVHPAYVAWREHVSLRRRVRRALGLGREGSR